MKRAAMRQEAERIAALIANDLHIKRGNTSFAACLDLCDMYGGSVFFIDMDDYCPAFYMGGPWNCIVISNHLGPREKATALIHELVHRLIYSDGYEPLNDGQYFVAGFDPFEFHEEICRAVERLFVKAGGYDLRKVWRYRS